MNRGDWMPPVDIYEENGALVLNAELPGMRREDIDVTVENNTLTVKGERKMEAGVKQENIHRLERAYGSFARSFSLPNSVDPTQISAEYRNGVLTLRLPYREEAKPRTISINVA
jgi:HSP20 family protein